MAWTIKYTANVLKELKKLDKPIAKKIIEYMEQIANINPRNNGKALKGNLKDFWRYRVGDYRIMCNLEDEILEVLVLKVSHRKEVYK